MPLLSPSNDPAPKADENLPWPIIGLAYVAVFMSPISAGPFVGIIGKDWRAFALGFSMGIGISFLNMCLFERYLEPLVARFQKPLQKGTSKVILNIVVFAWAFASSALSMFAPIIILGSTVLTKVR